MIWSMIKSTLAGAGGGVPAAVRGGGGRLRRLPLAGALRLEQPVLVALLDVPRLDGPAARRSVPRSTSTFRNQTTSYLALLPLLNLLNTTNAPGL